MFRGRHPCFSWHCSAPRLTCHQRWSPRQTHNLPSIITYASRLHLCYEFILDLHAVRTSSSTLLFVPRTLPRCGVSFQLRISPLYRPSSS